MRAAAPLPLLAVLVLYAWLSPWLPALRSPNELSRLYQARAIVEDHSLSVNGQVARHGPVGDLSIRDGRLYPNKAPGVSFLGAAVYAAIAPSPRPSPPAGEREYRLEETREILWLRLLVCVLPGALAAELLRRVLARRFEPPLATAGALAFALGTIAWPYSTFLMSHGPTTAALVGCWWAIDAGRRAGRRGWWALAGFLGGWAVLLEYTSAIALLPLGVYAGFPPPAARGEGQGEGWKARLLPAALGALPPLLALAAYHQAAFGHPLATGYRYLVNPVFAQWHARGFLGVGAPSWRALAGSFLDPARGLFAWCPLLALGPPGLALLWRKDRALAALCAGELAVYALFTASFTYEAWGWTVGPRHVTPLCAFLVPPAVAGAGWLRERGLGFLAGGLALAGVALVALTMAVCPYLPDELTNPFWQLVVPLAREGLHAPDVLARALGGHGWWTLLPWLVLLAGCAGFLAGSLAPRGGDTRRGGRARSLLLSLLVAAALLAGHARLGGPDRFAATRAFLAAQLRDLGR